jgi:hypothetical protein
VDKIRTIVKELDAEEIKYLLAFLNGDYNQIYPFPFQ